MGCECMEKNYRVTTFVMDSGERYCMVVDRASGLPMYYPTLFLTTQIRNREDAFSTMLAAANNLVMLKWFTEFGHLNRGDMLTSEQHRCHNEKKKFQRRV